MKKLLLIILMLVFSISMFLILNHQNVEAQHYLPDYCDSELSYVGNWDNHVGGCWIADIVNCAYCELL